MDIINMGWIKKLLGLKEKPLLNPTKEEIKEAKVEDKINQEAQKDLGECIFCFKPLNPPIRKIDGRECHKKCLEKSKKLMLQGISQEKMIKILQGGN